MNAGRHFSTDQLAIPSPKTGICGTRPLPARQAQQQGETNLDDGGELTVEVPVEWIPNQASHGFWPGQRTCGNDKVFAFGTNAKKCGEPCTRGCMLRQLGKQNGHSGGMRSVASPRAGGESAKTKFSCFFAISPIDLVPQLSW
jgi:hypothetical protein